MVLALLKFLSFDSSFKASDLEFFSVYQSKTHGTESFVDFS